MQCIPFALPVTQSDNAVAVTPSLALDHCLERAGYPDCFLECPNYPVERVT